MSPQNETAPFGGAPLESYFGTAGQPNNTPLQKPRLFRVKAGSKRAGVLKALLERPHGLTRFDAERPPIADHVLPTTISELCRDFGLEIPRKLETVPGYNGKPTECSRYRLSDEDRAKARALLADELEAAA